MDRRAHPRRRRELAAEVGRPPIFSWFVIPLPLWALRFGRSDRDAVRAEVSARQETSTVLRRRGGGAPLLQELAGTGRVRKRGTPTGPGRRVWRGARAARLAGKRPHSRNPCRRPGIADDAGRWRVCAERRPDAAGRPGRAGFPDGAGDRAVSAGFEPFAVVHVATVRTCPVPPLPAWTRLDTTTSVDNQNLAHRRIVEVTYLRSPLVGLATWHHQHWAFWISTVFGSLPTSLVPTLTSAKWPGRGAVGEPAALGPHRGLVCGRGGVPHPPLGDRAGCSRTGGAGPRRLAHQGRRAFSLPAHHGVPGVPFGTPGTQPVGRVTHSPSAARAARFK